MKSIFNIILVITVLACLTACSNEDISGNDSVQYYRFTSEDIPLIINYNYTPNQIITYQNEAGEKLHFKVLLNETQKKGSYSSGTFSGGGGLLENYYDSKIISFEILENENLNEESKLKYLFSKNKDQLKTALNFPMWNILSGTFLDEIQNNYNIYLTPFNTIPKTTVMINGHLFEKVVTVTSNSNDIIGSFGLLRSNVNEVTYDYDFGVIQFIEIDGTTWSVVYPE